MIIIGHSAIECEDFRLIRNIKDIKKSKADEIVYFPHNIALARYCKDNEIKFAVIVSCILELMIYEKLGAKYLMLTPLKFAQKCQKIANEYFFDSKILLIIKKDKDIEKTAQIGIDGVIFENHLKNLKSRFC